MDKHTFVKITKKIAQVITWLRIHINKGLGSLMEHTHTYLPEK